MRSASPLDRPVEVIDRAGNHVLTTYAVERGEHVLAGHYPGFPIFPGVCIVECAHQSFLATASAGGRRLRLAAVESTRFSGPVFPGDELTTEIEQVADGDRAWRCVARVSTGRGQVAALRLCYEAEEAR